MQINQKSSKCNYIHYFQSGTEERAPLCKYPGFQTWQNTTKDRDL